MVDEGLSAFAGRKLQSILRAAGRSFHFFHHFGHGDIHPAVSLAGAEHYSSLIRRVGMREKFIEQMNRVVEIIIVGVADGYAQLTP